MSQYELTEELIEEVTAGVLEEAAFVFVERAETEWEREEKIIRAQVEFEGTRAGHLAITSSVDFAAVLAANLLGLEPGEEALQYGEDALKELTNMIGGAFLARWLGTNVPYEMGVPATSQIDVADQIQAAADSTCRISLLGDEEYPIDVSVRVESGA